jgi:hypothetical protein
MSNITVASCALVQERELVTGPADEALAAGKVARFNATTGRLTLANASSAGEAGAIGIVVGRGAKLANEAATVVRDGIVDLGASALADFNFGDPVYLSDTDGLLATTAGTVSVEIGTVVAGWASGLTADKLLRVKR